MKTTTVKKASIRLPAKPKTKRVWIGAYGGHFSVVVVFNRKPKKGKKGAWNEGQYCTLENQDIIAGTFDEGSFNEWFGTDVKADDIEIYKVEPYDLTAIWDEYGQIVGLNPFEDR